MLHNELQRGTQPGQRVSEESAGRGCKTGDIHEPESAAAPHAWLFSCVCRELLANSHCFPTARVQSSSCTTDCFAQHPNFHNAIQSSVNYGGRNSTSPLNRLPHALLEADQRITAMMSSEKESVPVGSSDAGSSGAPKLCLCVCTRPF